jgi:hypothetical protein
MAVAADQMRMKSMANAFATKRVMALLTAIAPNALVVKYLAQVLAETIFVFVQPIKY